MYKFNGFKTLEDPAGTLVKSKIYIKNDFKLMSMELFSS